MAKKQLNDIQRSTICRKYDSGKNAAKIALELEINFRTVVSVINKYKITGNFEATKVRVPKRRMLDDEARKFIQQKIDEDVGITLSKLKDLIKDERGISTSVSTINNAIKEFNYSFKRIELIPIARNSERVINLRQTYCENYTVFDDDCLIFVDQFGISCSTRVKYGRSLKGHGPRKNIRSIRSKNLSVSAAIMKNQMILFKVQDRPYNGNYFLQFIENLIEKLNELNVKSGKIILDNASIHKGVSVKNYLMNKRFELIFLPPYSPQLNPIEEVFSKWKHLVKMENCETIEDLTHAIESAATLITRKDCNAFFSHLREFILKGIRREQF